MPLITDDRCWWSGLGEVEGDVSGVLAITKHSAYTQISEDAGFLQKEKDGER